MRRLALMIGINEYPNLAAPFQLKGCVNDQQLLRRLLESRFGFEPDDITLLLDGEATRENILRELDRLAGMEEFEGQMVVQEGDLVLISYSGHGSRLREPEDRRDEADGYDSTLVPCDSDRPRPFGRGGRTTEITDDELQARLLRIRERAAHVVLYFDCCHSGTISRDLEEGTGRELPPLEEGYDDVSRITPGPCLESGGRGLKGSSGWLPMEEGYVLLAGCADKEIAREYRDPATGAMHGALTYFLTRELERATGPLTYHDLFRRAQPMVTAAFPSQHPQMEGDWNRELFGLASVDVAPFARVEARVDETTVRIGTGAAQGATVGSRWAIMGRDLADEQLLAEVTIRSVGALSSEAASETPLPDQVQPECRAVEVEHAWGDMRVQVSIIGATPAEGKALSEHILASPVLQLGSGGPVDMAAVYLPARERVDPESDFAPELGLLSEPAWAIVGRDRRLLPLPPHSASEENALEDTLANLETWARYLQARRLAPAGPDPLRGKLTMRLLRYDPSGDYEEFPIDPSRSMPVIREGERVVIELTNRHGTELHYALYDMGPTGRIARLAPPSGAQEPLSPNFPLPLGAQIGGIPLSLPRNFPAALNGAIETLKLFVTTRYADFDTLSQEGGRLADNHALVTLFDATQNGTSRDLVLDTPLSASMSEESWTVEHVDFWVERKGT